MYIIFFQDKLAETSNSETGDSVPTPEKKQSPQEEEEEFDEEGGLC